MSIVSIVIFSLIYIGLSLLAKPFFIDNFSTGEDMKKIFDEIYTFYVVYFLFIDSVQCMLGNLLKAMGE